MKRILLFAVVFLAYGWGMMAQNFQISGGMRYSVALCESGNVITWGENSSGQLGRNTTKSVTYSSKTYRYDDVPTSINLKDPNNNPITIKQVDAGSGAHVVAIACDSTVWTWGNNEHGQLGNGFLSALYSASSNKINTCSDITSVDQTPKSLSTSVCSKMNPQHVFAGETNPTAPFSGYLKNVIQVSASYCASYAIVKDPITKVTNLLAWGSNYNYAAYCDAEGSLGTGKNSTQLIASAYPVYVRYKNKLGALVPLTNVIAVDAGDNNCFAIVDDDNDGDPTTGTVYGWGQNSYANITPTSTPAQVLWATPISIDALGTKPLTGIKSISAGDLFLLAYDKYGNAWTIGNEWCASGSNLSTRANGKTAWNNPKEAAKVVAGEQFTYNDGDNWLNSVKGIAAGQSSALTMVELSVNSIKSNYVLAWGSAYGSEDVPATGSCANDLGSNDAVGSLNPRFAYRQNWRTNVIEKVDSVVAISDGDGVSYLVRLEKNASGVETRQLYVTGTNGFGQLGFNPSTTKGLCVFKKLDLPACDLAAPCAIADLQAFSLCPMDTKLLFAGSDGEPTYHYVWQRFDSDGAFTADGLPGWYELYETSESNTSNVDNTKWTFDNIGTAVKPIRGIGDKPNFAISMNGKYKVSIYDTRQNLGYQCPTVWDTVTINYKKSPINSSTGEWCGTNTLPYTFYFTEPSYLASNIEKRFIFYGSDVSTKQLAVLDNTNFSGTSTNANLSLLFNTSDLEAVTDSIYQVWVADSTRAKATLLDKSVAPMLSALSTNVLINGTAMSNGYYLFTAYSDFILKSMMVDVKNYSTPTTLSVTPQLYTAVKSANGYTLGALVNTGAATQIVPVSSSTATAVKLNVNAFVTGHVDGRKVYILTFKIVNNTANGFQMMAPQLALSTPVSDAMGMMSLAFGGQMNSGEIRMTDQNNLAQNAPFPYNWQLEKTTSYECGRIPILFNKNCPPCKDPYREKLGESFSISANTSNACPGSVVALSTKTLANGFTNTDIEYAWFKGIPSANNNTPVTPWTKGLSSSYSFTAGTTEGSNDWYVVARDAQYSTDKACYDTAHIVINEHSLPSYQLSGGGYFCERSISPNVSVQLGKVAADTTGKTPWKIFYHFNTTSTSAPQSYTINSAAKEQVHSFTNLGAGLFVLDSVSDKYCSTKAVAADTIRNSQIVIDSVWNSKSIYTYCNGSTRPSIAVNTMKGNTSKTYTWMYKANGSNSFTAIPNLTTILSTANPGQYYVQFTNATGTVSCTKKTITKTVTRYPQPQFVLENGNTYCEGNTVVPITLKVSTDTLLAGNYGAWSITPSINGTAQTTIALAAGTILPKVAIGSAAGTYTAVLKNTTTGCSSAITSNAVIKINKPTANTIDTSVCEQFVYNNKTYTSSGVVTVTLRNAAGCDSVVTINLTVNKPITTNTETLKYVQITDTLNVKLDSVLIIKKTLPVNGSCEKTEKRLEITKGYFLDTIHAIACQSFTLNGKTYTKEGQYHDTVDRKTYFVYQTIYVKLGSKKETSIAEIACKSFIFKGKALTNSGIYRDTLKTKAGCDSIVILQLTINKYVSGTKSLKGCGTVSFNGKTYTQSGNFKDTIRNANGCDSAFVLSVIVNQAKSSSFAATACKSYNFNGNDLTKSGDYTYTTTAANGCDSIVTLSLTINTFKYDTVRVTACGSYNFAGKILANAGTYNDTIRNAQDCDLVKTLVLKLSNEITNQINATACKSFSFDNKTLTESGIYRDTLKTKAGCDSIVILQLSINKYVSATKSLKGCGTVSFNGKTYTQSGNFKDTIRNANGCDSAFVLSVIVNQAKSSSFAATACKSYNFHGNDLTKSGDYTYTTTATNGCDSIVTLSLTINTFKYDTVRVTACGSYNFAGKTLANAGTYNDTIRNAQDCDLVKTLVLKFSNEITNQINVTNCKSFSFDGKTLTESGEYRDTLKTKAGCDSIVILQLTINKYVSATKSLKGCGTVSFNGKTYIQSGNFKDTIRNANGCDSAFVLSVIVNQAKSSSFAATACKSYNFHGNDLTKSGDYTYTTTAANGCDSIVTLSLTINTFKYDTLRVTACGSYNFAGKTLANAGTYNDTIRNAQDCDLVKTLVLKLSNEITNQINVTDCKSFSFDGKSLTESGIYRDTLKTKAGCDSIVILQLTINKYVSATKSLKGCGTVLFNGKTYTQSGNFKDTIRNANGCDSAFVLSVIVNQAKSSSFAATACKSYNFNGNDVTKSGDYTYTTTAANGCDSIVTLSLTIENPTKTISVSQSTALTYNGKVYSKTGTYFDTLKYATACDTSVTIKFTLLTQNRDISKLTAALEAAKIIYNDTVKNGINFDSKLKDEFLAAINVGTSIVNAIETNDATIASQDSIDKQTKILQNLIIAGRTIRVSFEKTACGSYMFMNKEYSKSGKYIDTAKSTKGYDSIVSLQLNIVPIPTPRIVGSGALTEGESADYAALLSQSTSKHAWKSTVVYAVKPNDALTIKCSFASAKTDTIILTETYTENGLSCSASVEKVVVVSQRVSTNLLTYTDANVYPNPSSGMFTVSLPESKSVVCMIRLVAANGDAWSWPALIIDNKVVVDQSIAAGSYTLEVATDLQIFTAKVVIQ